MRKKLLILLLSVISTVCLAAGLAACDSESGANEGSTSESNYSSSQGSSSDGDGNEADSWYDGVYTINTAYAAATDLGYSGTLDEFIASISGTNGTDGVSVTAIVINTKGELVITLSSGGDVNLGKITGDDGADGSVWYTGTGAPSTDTGKDGDMYLDTSSYDIYTKASGTWTKTGNLKGGDGSNGDDGTDGSVWYTGTGAPSADTGKDGDMYLDTSSYDIYAKANGAWTKTGNIKGGDGSNGDDGADGSVWYTGTGAPSADTGKDGDMYLDTSSYDIYVKASGTWAKTGNIKGGDGSNGDNGEDGSVWYTGAGAPSADTGKDGDMYLDTSSYDIYAKADGTWAKTGNIKGGDGSKGDTGVGIASVEINEKGELVITLTDNSHYEFTLPTTETTEYTLTYEENDSGYTVTGVSSKDVTSVEIPATYNNKAVTAIGSKAFANCIYLEEVTIPDSVTTIGNYAFYNCSMLESIILPEGVTSMGKGVLYGCDFLQSLTFSFNYDSTSHIGYLFGASDYIYNYVYIPVALTEVTVTGTLIPDYAFESCYNIESVIIESEITSIGTYAFESCTSLNDITINGTITTIGGSAFYNTAYYKKSSNWENRVLYIGNCLVATKSVSGSYTVKDGTTVIAACAFSNMFDSWQRSITDISIPGTVINIGEYAFWNCYTITKVTISKGVQSIGEYAFDNCTALVEINIPSSITSISDYTFNGCTSLKEIIIPDSVTSIGKSAFSVCTALTSVTISEGVESIDNYAFYGCTALTKITIPGSVKEIGEYAFYGCTNAASITLGTGVVSIGRNAFANCATITEINIPDNVVYLGIQAFYGCTSLATITISKNIKLIGSNAFTDTAFYNDESNYIDGVLYIDTYLLRAKTTISGSYTVKAGTTVIASRAFEDCTELTSVTIASSVTIVGGSVFNGCTALTEVTFSNSDNWYRTTENTFIDGTSTDLSDASTNATYFTDTYYKLYWYQLETTTD